MARILFAYVLPFLFPSAVCAVWLWYRARYVERHGGDAPALEKGPWPLMLFLGALLTLAILAVTALTGGGPAGSHYVPAHIDGGKMVPGHLEPK